MATHRHVAGHNDTRDVLRIGKRAVFLLRNGSLNRLVSPYLSVTAPTFDNRSAARVVSGSRKRVVHRITKVTAVSRQTLWPMET